MVEVQEVIRRGSLKAILDYYEKNPGSSKTFATVDGILEQARQVPTPGLIFVVGPSRTGFKVYKVNTRELSDIKAFIR